MAQRRILEMPTARRDIPPPTSRLSPASSQHQQQQQQQQQQQPRRYDAESWIEVASQPSSSSLSSIGDEIVTTGLQVGNPYQNPRHHRRRRLRASSRSLLRQQTAPPASGTSSQEESDESDSDDDDDRVLACSGENSIHSPSSAEEAGVESDDFDDGDDDDGDDATALGATTDKNTGRPTFQPQPNVFSHPPTAHLAQRSHSTTDATVPHPHSSFARRSFPGRSQGRVQRGPSFMSPSVREDNDAALRASLTTLLSCAAAARGLPKSSTEEATEAQRGATGNGVGPSSQPMELQFVPEADLMDESNAPARPRQEHAERAPPATTRARESPKPACEPQEKTKRPGSPSRSSRATRKKRASASASASAAAAAAGAGHGVVTEEALISPTLLTWVVSAGVVVLVSFVTFSAGYVIGREAGRQESLAASISGGFNDTASSGREVIRSSGGSLRRFKWGAVGRSIVAAA